MLGTVVAASPASPAIADSGGSTLPRPTSKQQALPAPMRPGRRPRLADVRCASNPSGPCLDVHRAERGATLRLRGRSLAGAKQIIFYGARGAADNVVGPVQSAQARSAVATVPPQALTGPVAVIDAAGQRSNGWDGLVIDIPQQFAFRPASLVPGVEVGLSEPRTIFYGGMQRAIEIEPQEPPFPHRTPVSSSARKRTIDLQPADRGSCAAASE